MKRRRACLLMTISVLVLLPATGRSAAPSSTIEPAVAGHPAPRAHASSVYDARHSEFLVYGGYTFDNGVKMLDDLWAWNGTSWHLVGQTGIHKVVAALTYDSKRQRVLMFGGMGDGNRDDGKINVLEGDHWKTIAETPSMARNDAGMAYDVAHDQAVMFGGRSDQINFADTWTFDGATWTQTWMAGPSLRSAPAMAYDQTRGVTILYGGFRPLAALGDTWEWNGKSWSEVTKTGPGPRAWPGMAYDSKRHRTLLFGGEDDKGQFYNDIWAWDGKTWTKIASNGPSPRIQFVMGYDTARDRLVIFGGMDALGHYVGDTWEFDGKEWHQNDTAEP